MKTIDFVAFKQGIAKQKVLELKPGTISRLCCRFA